MATKPGSQAKCRLQVWPGSTVGSLSVSQTATRQAAATATVPAAEAAAWPHRKEELPPALIPTKDDWPAQKTPTFCCSYKAANETGRRVSANTLVDCLLACLRSIFVTVHQAKSNHIVIVGHAPNRRANAGKSPRARTLNAGPRPSMVERERGRRRVM
ncbi:hypothetical protein BKA80DRAFT_281042 [Phyllosticta citrichinensis]